MEKIYAKHEKRIINKYPFASSFILPNSNNNNKNKLISHSFMGKGMSFALEKEQSFLNMVNIHLCLKPSMDVLFTMHNAYYENRSSLARCEFAKGEGRESSLLEYCGSAMEDNILYKRHIAKVFSLFFCFALRVYIGIRKTDGMVQGRRRRRRRR